MGAARCGEAGSDGADGGSSAWFVPELGPAGLIAVEAWSHLTRVGSAGSAARGSVADVGFARCTPTRGSWRRCSGSHLGLAWCGPAARGAGALVGRAAASFRAASISCAAARRTGCGTTRTVMGRTGGTRAVVGRARPGGRRTRRAVETCLPDSTFLEPAASGMGPAQARGAAATGPGFWRLGRPSRGCGRAAADCRPFVGGARRTSPGQVRFLERAGSARLGHAEDRRAGGSGGAFVGSTGRATG